MLSFWDFFLECDRLTLLVLSTRGCEFVEGIEWCLGSETSKTLLEVVSRLTWRVDEQCH